MSDLARVTTEYVAVEDRIRLSGESGQAAPVSIWLTLRLLQRLLPLLLEWVEGRDGAAALHSFALHSFAQQAARAELAPQAPVRPPADHAAWLALEVELVRSPRSVRLTLRGAADGQAASLELTPKPLRQWLGIVHDAYVKGGWPLDAWPAWMARGALPPGRQGALLH